MNLKIAAINLRPVENRFRGGHKVKSRVYVWPQGESLIDNLMNRRSRPINDFRSVASRALSGMGVDLAKIEMKWSQKAGCSCGCSPGFVIDGFDLKIDGRDVYVDVEMI